MQSISKLNGMRSPRQKRPRNSNRFIPIIFVAGVLGLSLATHFLFFKPTDTVSASNLASFSTAPSPVSPQSPLQDAAPNSEPPGGDIGEILGGWIADPGSIEVSVALSVAGLFILLLLILSGIRKDPRTRKKRWRPNRIAVVLALAMLGGLSLFFVYNSVDDIDPVQAAIETSFTIDISLNSPIAGLDTTPSSGPLIGTIWGKVTNSTTGSAAIDVSVTLGNFANGLALKSGQSATYTIPKLAAGSSQAFFWFVTYSETNGDIGEYKVTASASNALTGTSNKGTITSTTIGSNNSNKINSVSASTTAVSVGETMTVTVEFDLGQVGSAGDAWVQPVSNTDFDGSVVRLISAQVSLDTGSGLVDQTQDELYFTGLSAGVTGKVVYTFQGIGTGSTSVNPYQLGAQGGSGARAFTKLLTNSQSITGNAFQGTLSVSVSPETGADPGDTVTYTLSIGNDGSGTLGDPSNGNGVIVTATIASATTYVTGSVVDDAGFTVQFSTDSESTWSETDGGTSTTHVRWILTNGVTGATSNAVSDVLQTKVKPAIADGSNLGLITAFGVGTVTEATTVTSAGVVGDPGALTSASVVPDSLAVSAAGNVAVSFVVENALPADGKIVVIFPSGFTLNSGGTTGISTDNFDGTTAVTGSSSTVTITRLPTATEIAASSTVTFTLTFIKNPTVTGSSGAYTIKTQTSSATVIDQNTSVAASTITAAALTKTNVQPESLVASVAGDVDVSFTVATSLAANEVIVVTFPSGFTLSSGGTTGLGGDGISAGSATVGVSGSTQIVVITRTGGSTFSAGTAVTLELTNIKNPASGGSTGTYSIKTESTSGVTIDQDTSVTADTIIGLLTSTNVEPDSLSPEAVGNVTVTFTTTGALPNTGIIVVTFPSSFTLSSGATTGLGSDAASFDGTATVGVSGSQIVTITRSGGSEVAAGTAVTVEITNIKNPTEVGSTGTYIIKTDTSSGVPIDTDPSVSADTIGAGSLTSANVEPESLAAGSVGDVDVSLTLANPLPNDGIIVVTFPSTFTLSSGATTGLGSDGISAGSATVGVSGSTQIVVITRTGGSTFSAGTTVTVELTNIKNLTTTGSTGTYSIKTDNASGTTIEQDTSVTADTITPGVLTSTNVEPESLTIGVVGDVDVSFTIVNPLPLDGQIVVTFPSGFTISSGATTGLGGDAASFDGTATVGVSGSTIVTITRSGGSEAAASTAVTVELTNIKNPTSTGSTGTYSIKTDNSTGVTIDELTTVSADTIISASSGGCTGAGCGAGTLANPTISQTPTTDLEVTITVSTGPSLVSANLTYTVTVTNNGPLPSISTTLNDTLPAGVSHVSTTASVGDCNNTSTVTCQLGYLASGDSATVSIVVTLETVGTIINTATVTGNRTDSNSANNSDAVTTLVSDPLTVELTYEPSGGVQAGDILVITATFSREFTGAPTITIETPGGDLISAVMTATGDGKVWTFTYQVPPDIEGEGTITITVPGETVSIPTIGASTNVFSIKSIGPAVSLTYAPERPVREGEILTITATFDQEITGTPTIAIDTRGSDLSPASMTDSGDGRVWRFAYEVPADSEGAAQVTIAGAANQAGTPNLPATNDKFPIGGARTSVRLTYSPDRDLRAGETLLITATFSEPPIGTPTIAIDTEGIDLAPTEMTPSADGTEWTFEYQVPAGSDGVATVIIGGVQDDEGNPIQAILNVTLNIDNTGPTAVLTYDPSGSVSPGETLVITATFSEPIVGTPTISIDTSGADLPAAPLTDSGDGKVWTYSYQVPEDGDGVATVTIAGGTDEAGNPAVEATNVTFSIERVALTVEITYDPDRDVKPGETLTITATFSGAFLGTPTIAIDIDGPDLQAAAMTPSGDRTEWTFSYQVPDGADGIATVTIGGVTDAAGNTGIPASNNSFFIDGASIDLSITVAASTDPVSRRDILTYTITVSNNGTSNATGVTLTNTLPQDVTFVSSSAGSSTCNESAGTVNCGLGDLADGLTVNVTIEVTVNPAAEGVIVNVADVAGEQPDPNLANNEATVETNVLVGELTYRLTIRKGDLDATGVTLRDFPDPVFWVWTSPTL